MTILHTCDEITDPTTGFRWTIGGGENLGGGTIAITTDPTHVVEGTGALKWTTDEGYGNTIALGHETGGAFSLKEEPILSLSLEIDDPTLDWRLQIITVPWKVYNYRLTNLVKGRNTVKVDLRTPDEGTIPDLTAIGHIRIYVYRTPPSIIISYVDIVQSSKPELTPRTITGTVMDTQGQPIAEATVTAKNTYSATTLTDPNGVFTLNVSAEVYTVTASKPGYYEASATVDTTLGDKVQDFTLEKAFWPIRAMHVWHYWDRFGSPGMSRNLDDLLAAFGSLVNYVEFRAYWNVNPDDPNDVMPDDYNGRCSWADVEAMIDQVHQKGLKAWLTINQVYGDGGRIDPNPTDWTTWFTNYKNKIVIPLAKMAEQHNVEILAIGMEYIIRNSAFFDASHPDAALIRSLWSDLIASVRQVFSGQITYCANWYFNQRTYDNFIAATWLSELDFITIDHWSPLLKECTPYDFETAVQKIMEGWHGAVPTTGNCSVGIQPYGGDWIIGYQEIAKHHNKKIVINTGLPPVYGASRCPTQRFICSSTLDFTEQQKFWTAFFRTWISQPFIQGVMIESYDNDQKTNPSTNIASIRNAPAQVNIAEGLSYVYEITNPRVISGTVTNAETGEPIENVEVKANMLYSTRTLADGTYSLTVEAGVYDVTFSKEGYEPQKIIDVDATIDVVLNVALKPAPTPTPPCPAAVIATCVYGPSIQLNVIRNFRDNFMSRTATGRWLARTYYRIGKYIAKLLMPHDTVKRVAKGYLNLLVWALRRGQSREKV